MTSPLKLTSPPRLHREPLVLQSVSTRIRTLIVLKFTNYPIGQGFHFRGPLRHAYSSTISFNQRLPSISVIQALPSLLERLLCAPRLSVYHVFNAVIYDTTIMTTQRLRSISIEWHAMFQFGSWPLSWQVISYSWRYEGINPRHYLQPHSPAYDRRKGV